MAVSDPPLEETKTKIFKTRIKQRRDTSANWESKNPVLLNGEVIIVDTANGETRTKTGNGTKTYTQLPFDDEGSKGGKSLIDKSFADNVSTSGNTTTIDKQLKTYSVTTRLEADVVITGLDENGQEVTKHKLSEKVDKVEGKSLIDENVASRIQVDSTDNSLFIASTENDAGWKYTPGSEKLRYTSPIGDNMRLVYEPTDGLEIVNRYGSPDITVIGSDKTHKLSEKANATDVALLQYYGTTDITISDSSYFTVNETGETITGLTDTGKTQTELVIPYKINGVKITKLSSGHESSSEQPVSIFKGSSTITKVVIPKSVTTLGRGAFFICRSLTSIDIPNSVISIGDYAFAACSGLKSINLPNGVTSIGKEAFNGCSSLAAVTIPNSVTSIGSNAFGGCTSLKSIDIPNSVTTIGDHAFNACSALTLVKIPNSVTSIGDYAFSSGDPATLTIYCEPGSHAETFAKNNNISVAYTDIKEDVIHNKAEAKTYTVSIPTTSWTEETDTDNQKYYYKKITVSGMTASGQAMTDVAMSDSVATARKEMEAYQCVNRVVTGADYVELYCFDEVPTTAFTLRILVISNILS